jgi:hypothetical protein
MRIYTWSILTSFACLTLLTSCERGKPNQKLIKYEGWWCCLTRWGTQSGFPSKFSNSARPLASMRSPRGPSSKDGGGALSHVSSLSSRQTTTASFRRPVQPTRSTNSYSIIPSTSQNFPLTAAWAEQYLTVRLALLPLSIIVGSFHMFVRDSIVFV